MQEKNTLMNNFFEMVKWLCDSYYDGKPTKLAEAAKLSQPTTMRIYKREVDEPKQESINKILNVIKENNIQLPDKYRNLSFIGSENVYEQKIKYLENENKDLQDKLKLFKIQYDECIEEIEKLKKLLALYDKVLETCSPPNDVEERRFCRIEYLKLVKKFGLKTT